MNFCLPNLNQFIFCYKKWHFRDYTFQFFWGGGLHGSGRTPYTLVYRFLALLTRPLDIIISSGRVKRGRGKNYPAPKIF